MPTAPLGVTATTGVMRWSATPSGAPDVLSLMRSGRDHVRPLSADFENQMSDCPLRVSSHVAYTWSRYGLVDEVSATTMGSEKALANSPRRSGQMCGPKSNTC